MYLTECMEISVIRWQKTAAFWAVLRQPLHPAPTQAPGRLFSSLSWEYNEFPPKAQRDYGQLFLKYGISLGTRHETPIRPTPIRYIPGRHMPARCMPMRCMPVRYPPMKSTPKRRTPMRCMPHEIYAHEKHAREKHAYEIPAHKMPAEDPRP
jgi:hypothetical protein